MFACPNCQTRLTKQPSPEGPRWVCGASGGRAVHLPSLRCTPPGAFVRRLWALARNVPSAEHKRPCPICDNVMATVPTIAVPGSGEPLRLDLCLSCQFVWFDPNEHDAWVRASSFAATDAGLPAETRAALARLPPDPPPNVVPPEGGTGDHEGSSDHEFELKYLICLLGLPVEVDPPPLHTPPWCTWTLIGLVTAVSIGALPWLPEAVSAWGFVPAEMWRHGGLTLITPFFLHAGLVHLLGNMYFLLVFGDNVEDLLGRSRYLALLLTATVAGSLLYAAAIPLSRTPCIGASGGIAGVMVYYGLLFPKGRLKVGLQFRIFEVNVWVALVLWVIIQLIGMIGQTGTQVAYAAHAGGALAGLIFWSVNGLVSPRVLSVEATARR